MNSCLPFAANFMQEILQNDGFSKNIALSPLSLNVVVAMVAAGCSGSSLKRILSFVGCDDLDQVKSLFPQMMSIIANSNSSSGFCFDSGPPPKISFVNGVWVANCLPLKPSYHRCVTDVFKSDAKNVDFQKVDEVLEDVNSWAELHTNGLIKNVLRRSHISPDHTAFILGNALYFKGTWAHEFDPECTLDRKSTLLNFDKVSVPSMLCSDSGYYLYRSFDDFKVIELPYKSGGDCEKRFAMQFILPHMTDGLRDLQTKLFKNTTSAASAADSSSGGLFNFELERTTVDVVMIPKFKFTSTFERIQFPFMDEHMQLTEMFDARGEGPTLSQVIQKAFIEVDEKGTEAAAVTLGTAMWCSETKVVQKEFKEFIADHPFMFVVKEVKTGLVLFVGTVVNPLLAAIE